LNIGTGAIILEANFNFGRDMDMSIRFGDLESAYLQASLNGFGEQEVYLNRQTGEIHFHSEFGDNIEELPDDIDDEKKYARIPGQKDLDLGQPLIRAFAEVFMPGDYDEIRDLFRRKGAYGRFKSLLSRRRLLDQWHDFQNKAEEKALREWCQENSIELAD